MQRREKKRERENTGNRLTLHSLLVSTMRSPSTRPQLPHTRSPLPNSSTIFGLGSLHSGQMRRTAKSGPYVGCWTFCTFAARGNGCENAMIGRWVCAESGLCEGYRSEWQDNGAVSTTQTEMNVSPDLTSYQDYDSGFWFQECDCRGVLNEGDDHGVVVVRDKESLVTRAVVRAIKCATLTKQSSHSHVLRGSLM